ncbi:TetR/AcrR family transcriptional regulator [Rugosimonospora acidiphila]
MGNREDLLAGALRCLKEKGWSRTTVRDIAAAAGVNHAAIGYHFGSREALLMAAFTQAMEEWGAEVGRALYASMDPAAPAGQQYEAMWREMIGSFTANRQLWLASIEAFVQAEHNPKLRELLAASQREGRRGLAASIAGVDEDTVDDAMERRIGGVQSALLIGVLLQWLLDPQHAPTASDVVDGVRALAARAEAASPGVAEG